MTLKNLFRILVLGGMALVVYGVWLAWAPGGFMVAGLFLFWLGFGVHSAIKDREAGGDPEASTGDSLRFQETGSPMIGTYGQGEGYDRDGFDYGGRPAAGP